MKLSRKSKVVLVLLMVAASACFAQKWKSREKNNLIWLFHKNLKINAVLENAFKCKIRHVFFSVKTFTEIIFYSSSLPAL